MIRRIVVNLITALAAGIKDILNLDSETVRQMVLTALRALQQAAQGTATIFDDMVVKLAIELVESSAWELLWKMIFRQAQQAAQAAEAGTGLSMASTVPARDPNVDVLLDLDDAMNEMNMPIA